MKTFTVIRTNSSPYHGKDFEQNEQMRLEKISGLNYRNLEEAIPEEPVILITNTHTRLNQLSPDLLKSTKLIVHSNSGYDNFTEDRKLWENIPIIVGHEIRAQAVAEYYLSALLNGLSEIPQHLIWNRSRRWERPLIKDQNILLIGHGHVGQILNKALKALGCNVVIIDPLSGGDFSRWEEVKLDEYKIVLKKKHCENFCSPTPRPWPILMFLSKSPLVNLGTIFLKFGKLVISLEFIPI